MKPLKWIFFVILEIVVLGILPALMFAKGNSAMPEERAELCPRIIQLEQKYENDFFNEEGHKFDMKGCTKDAVLELTMLVEMQQRLDYADAETAKTFRKLCHAAYGNNIQYGNCSFKDAQNFAKEALRLDSSINDCLTLALAGVKEPKACKIGEAGTCKMSKPKATKKEEVKEMEEEKE